MYSGQGMIYQLVEKGETIYEFIFVTDALDRQLAANCVEKLTGTPVIKQQDTPNGLSNVTEDGREVFVLTRFDNPNE